MNQPTNLRDRIRARGGRGSRGSRVLIVVGVLFLAALAWGGYQLASGGAGAGTAPSAVSSLPGFPGFGGERDAATEPAMPPAPMPAAPVPGVAADEALRSVITAEDGGTGALPSFDSAGRTIIRSGYLELEVEEVDTAYHRVQQIASGAGGFVADSSFSGGQQGNQRATLTIRVPAERFNEVTDQLRELAVEVRSQQTSAQDVTEEYTDLQSTLRNLRAVEAQYLELLGRANQIGDILQVQERLNGVRQQIERIEGRMRMLDNLSDLATLTVSLRPAPDGAVTVTGGTIGEAVRDAWQASLRTLETIATVALVIVVFSWWLIPVVVIALVLLRRWLRQPAPRPAGVGVDSPGGAA